MKLTIAFFKDADWWVAQCKEINIAAQAKDYEGILFEIGRVLSAHVTIANEEGRQPFDGIGPTPEGVWSKCERRA